MFRSRFLTTTIALCLLLLFVGLLAPRQALAQSKSYHMDQYNSDITVNTDGSLDVRETLVYVYDSGSFHRGTRTWSTDRVDNIDNLQVSETSNGQNVPYSPTSYDPDDSTSGQSGTFGTTTEGGQFKVRWVYDYTANSSRTFVLSYHVSPTVKVYPDRDEFDWYAVPPDWGSPISQSRVRVTFPNGMDTSKLKTATVPSVAEVSPQGNNIVWTASSGLDSGFEVGAQLPKGLLQPVKPQWQQALDRQQEYNTKRRPLVDLGLLLLGVLVLAGGVLLGIMRWYRSGRDKPVKLLSDYITEPPSNLPPGLVGTLLDESADIRDVIASVVEQGTKGNLTIQETDRGGLFSAKDFQYQQTGNKVDFRFEEMVLNSIFKHGNPVSLSDLKNTFYSDLPPIYDSMYQSLVALKYFPENPKAVRGRNVAAGIGIVLLAGLLGFGAIIFGDSVSWFLFAPAFGLGVTGLIWIMLAGVMPRKTDFGAEEAEKWRAFGRYLQQMQRYTDVQAAADKFQKYLPYAVAMGFERQLISQFNSVPAAMPAWYAPYGYSPYGYYPYPVGSMAGGQLAGPGGGGGGAMPPLDPGAAMQGMSNSLASAMQGMSDSFTSMVNSASSIMTSAPSSSGSGGGGWGGGGGSFGGGGGGGGGGGAD